MRTVRVLLVLAVASAGLYLLTGASQAATMSLPVPLTIIHSAPQGPGVTGGTYQVGTVDNGAARGRVCQVSISNNESVRQGSDVTFTSGSQSVTLLNVEGSSPRTTSGELTLEGPQTTVSVTINAPNDPQFSGSDAVLTCPDPPPTTTEPPGVVTCMAVGICPPPVEPPVEISTAETVVREQAPADEVVDVAPAFTG